MDRRSFFKWATATGAALILPRSVRPTKRWTFVDSTTITAVRHGRVLTLTLDGDTWVGSLPKQAVCDSINQSINRKLGMS